MPAAKVLAEDPHLVLDHFSRKCLSSYGFARIADKILVGSALNVSEIEMLLTKAPLPVLFKLVQLKARRRFEGFSLQAFPQLLLPIEGWLDHGSVESVIENACRVLQGIDYQEVRVVVDITDFSNLEIWSEVLEELQHCRSGLSFTAPSVDSVLDWLNQHDHTKNRSIKAYKLERLLVQIRAAGFDQLEASSRRGLLRAVYNAGFPVASSTYVSRFAGGDMLARELYRLNKYTARSPIVDSWSPAIVLDQKTNLGVSLDLLILKVFAAATLCLKHIPRRRASGSNISLDAIAMLPEAGSNEYVFGAVNGETHSVLSMHNVENLRERIPVHGGGEEIDLWDAGL